MIKRLRNRMLLMNMLALTAVALLAIGAVYAATYAKTMQEIEGRADQAHLTSFSNRLVLLRAENDLDVNGAGVGRHIIGLSAPTEGQGCFASPMTRRARR